MSQSYSLEPPTNGKVLLKTSRGELDIELWPREAPLAVRNFVQLCLEGYYDNISFHRIIRNYLVQGGDPTGTGQGGQSIYGKPFKDEIHSRLKFTHRGIVACANENIPDSNGSQFFITLDRATHLQKKATIFGKVVGGTVFNLNRFNDVETDSQDRPIDSVIIEKAEVLINPFDDIRPRVGRKGEPAEKPLADAQRRSIKNLALVSFDEEDNDDLSINQRKNRRFKRQNVDEKLPPESKADHRCDEKMSYGRTDKKPISNESPQAVQHTNVWQHNTKDHQEVKESHIDSSKVLENMEPDVAKISREERKKTHTSVINARRGKYSGYSQSKKPAKLRKLETMKKIENFAASNHMRGLLREKGTNSTGTLNGPSSVSRLEQLLQDSDDDENLY